MGECVHGRIGGLVQQRNSISISDNTQERGVGVSDNTAYSQGETDTLTLKHKNHFLL